MRAAVVERYGPPEVVVIREVPKPVPGPGEILVRIRVTTVNSGDVRIRAMNVPLGFKTVARFALGFTRPKLSVLGFDAAGDVEAVGPGVTRFKAGDRVVGSHGFKYGLHAEYSLFKESDAIVPIPASLSYQDAVSLCFGGSTALAFFSTAYGNLKSGEALLINGASGAVGVAAVQLAKYFGAEVTAVCSAANADLVRSLGATHVIDYAHEDFVSNGKSYDLIMDNVGNAPYPRIRGSLTPKGRFLMVIFANGWQMVSANWNKKVVSVEDDKAAVTPEAYRRLMELGEAGVLKPVIDKVYAFENIVEAHRHVDSGRKRGSVVVTVG